MPITADEPVEPPFSKTVSTSSGCLGLIRLISNYCLTACGIDRLSFRLVSKINYWAKI